MAFYFFIVAFISNRKQDEEKTYYDEPEIEKVKDITFAFSNNFEKEENEVNDKEDATSSVPSIIESNSMSTNSEEVVMTQSTPMNSEHTSMKNSGSVENNFVVNENKIIIDEEII